MKRLADWATRPRDMMEWAQLAVTVRRGRAGRSSAGGRGEVGAAGADQPDTYPRE